MKEIEMNHIVLEKVLSDGLIIATEVHPLKLGSSLALLSIFVEEIGMTEDYRNFRKRFEEYANSFADARGQN